jgi:hypothetical protein
VVDAEAICKDTKAVLKRMEDNYNTLERSLDNLNNEFKPLKARVVAAKL